MIANRERHKRKGNMATSERVRKIARVVEKEMQKEMIERARAYAEGYDDKYLHLSASDDIFDQSEEE